MRARLRGLVAAVALGGALAVLVPVVAEAFTGTRAALNLVSKMISAYSKVPTVTGVLTGDDIVYCPAYPEGWTYAPSAGCAINARVSEEDQLSNGQLVRAVGLVSAPSQPTLRYVISAKGWYRQAVGATCWQRFQLPFVSPLYVNFPFPGETLSILSTTKSQIVIQALTPKFGYRELDYVNAKTYLEPHEVVYTTTKHKTYRFAYNFTFPTTPPPSVTTPTCAG